MGILYVVATPIGNLGDISQRALEVLRTCNLIAAEDTRVTIKLLNHFSIQTPQTSYHEHNEEKKSEQIIDKIINDDIDVALVTDAGTPCISDPGYILVQKAAQRGIQVIPVPGASAGIAALSASGFDTKEFAFFGFLPREKKAQQEKLLQIAEKTPVAVIYESPYRIIQLFENLSEILSQTRVALFSDLTKRFEKDYRGSASEVLEQLRDNPKADKGEYVAVFSFEAEITDQQEATEEKLSLEAQLFHYIYAGHTFKESINLLIEKGEKKNEAYQASLRLKNYLSQWED